MKTRSLLLALVLGLPVLAAIPPQRAGAQAAQAHFRVSVFSIRCNTPTYDDATQWDGAGDEVYVLADFAELSNTNRLVGFPEQRQSLIYGDVHGHALPRRLIGELEHRSPRIAAGTASASGGLNAGDTAPDPRVTHAPLFLRSWRGRVMPMIVWQGQLRRGGPAPNGVLILPTIWEVDTSNPLRPEWDTQAAAFLKSFAMHDSARFINGTATRPLVTQSATVLGWIPNQLTFDRPVGLKGGGYNPAAASPESAVFNPAVILLTFDAAVSAAASTLRSTLGRPGFIDVRYTDGENYGPGDYTLTLRLERISG